MKTPWTYSVTGYQMTGKSHEEIRDLCLAAGFAGIEGAPPLFANLSLAECERIGGIYREAGLAVDSFHLPFSREEDITSFYETTRRKAVDEIKRWMETAAAAGSRTVIQHPGNNPCSPDVEGLDPFLRSLEKSLAELLPWAEQMGLTIAIENMLPGPNGCRLGSKPEHFTEMLRRFAHPRLGFCLDTGHALIAAHEQADLFFEAMRPALAAFHLADNAGDRDSHLAPGRGRVDWASLFRKMKASGFDGIACVETPPFHYGPAYSPAAWKTLLEETVALSDSALAS